MSAQLNVHASGNQTNQFRSEVTGYIWSSVLFYQSGMQQASDNIHLPFTFLHITTVFLKVTFVELDLLSVLMNIFLKCRKLCL